MNEENELERDSFIFYRSFFESIRKIENKEDRASVYDAICELALNGKEIELTGIADIVFPLIKPQIQANNKRYLNGCKPKDKQNTSKTQAKPKQATSKTQANVNENVNDNVNENVNEKNIWFDAFWKLYPRKVNKKKSKEKFIKICTDEEKYNEIMKGLKVQITSEQWKKDNGQFVPHPTTWLNGERWLDEVENNQIVERRVDYETIATEQDDVYF